MTSATFSMRMDAKTKGALEAEAKLRDRSAAYIANKAIEDFLDKQVYKRESLRAAIEEADKGVFISGEAVERWMERWADGHDDPFPEPDIFPESEKDAAA
jgi:predicted transcriptional regulator